MKKILFALFLVAILITGVTIAYAETNAAIILRHNDSCWLPDASGSFDFKNLWPVPNCSHCLVTSSEPLVQLCVFTGKLPEGAMLPKSTVRFTYENSAPFKCWLSPVGPWSEQYMFTVTPSGQASGYCIFVDK